MPDPLHTPTHTAPANLTSNKTGMLKDKMHRKQKRRNSKLARDDAHENHQLSFVAGPEHDAIQPLARNAEIKKKIKTATSAVMGYVNVSMILLRQCNYKEWSQNLSLSR